MAANLQQMAAAGQMMPQQQLRRPGLTPGHLSAIVTQSIAQNGPVSMGWQSNVQLSERMGKTVQLYALRPFRLLPGPAQRAECAKTDALIEYQMPCSQTLPWITSQ